MTIRHAITRPSLLMHHFIAIIIPNMQSQMLHINIPMIPNQQRTKHRLSQQVQNPVKDGLGISRNDVATLAQAPGNGVQDPQEGG
jgi:hypothetical protein